VSDRCGELAAEGVAASLIEDQDFSPVLRAKEDAATAEQVRATANLTLATLSSLGGGSEPGGRHAAPVVNAE
jgi:V/A-type H+/Na+-transporting ATPase subunit A